jgi:hypothetical protein
MKHKFYTCPSGEKRTNISDARWKRSRKNETLRGEKFILVTRSIQERSCKFRYNFNCNYLLFVAIRPFFYPCVFSKTSKMFTLVLRCRMEGGSCSFLPHPTDKMCLVLRCRVGEGGGFHSIPPPAPTRTTLTIPQ